MKKISIILAMAALGVAFTSCKQEDEPQYKAPTEFIISTPALQNTAFRTAPEMTDEETFNLFCTQPNYGYSAICNYSAMVSLDPKCPIDEDGNPVDGMTMLLPNENPTQAAMAIKTFELGAAVNKLKGITSQEAFDAAGMGKKVYKCYFRAVCEIPGIEGSRIVSSNVVSYNQVYLTYAEKKAAWIYICGDVQTDEAGTVKNGFLTPGGAENIIKYDEYWRVYEPEDKIGQKLFVGTFWLTPKDPNNFNPINPDPEKGEFNEGNPNACAQFRFFTKLVGWKKDYSLGSHSDDFYVVKITDRWVAGYNGDIVDQGLGNWGIFVEKPAQFTVVVDVKDLKIFVKEGAHEVSFTGRDPEFK